MSTHALMRGAVVQLNRWGLLPSVVAAGTPAIRSTTFHYGDEAIRVDIKPEHGVDCLFAPRRTVLDPLLVDAALEAGAEVRHGVALSELQFAASGRVIGALLRDAGGGCTTVRSDIVIGADGRQSTVAQLVNAKTYVEGLNASGIVFGYYEDLNWDGLHWHFAKKAAAGVIPTNFGHCVFAAVPTEQFGATFRGDVMRGFLQVLEAEPALSCAPMSSTGYLIGRLRGFGGATQLPPTMPRSRLGTRRRCRLFQGSPDRSRDHRRPSRRGAVVARRCDWKPARLSRPISASATLFPCRFCVSPTPSPRSRGISTRSSNCMRN